MTVLKDPRGRSYLPIARDDLLRLARLARDDRRSFFAHSRGWSEAYRDRVLCVALCQGAALHFVDGRTGINDFDVYTFYARNPSKRWCDRRRQPVDFGHAKFGRSEVSPPQFVGRRVDLMGRTLPVAAGSDPVVALRRYLAAQRSDTARLLAEKAVVLLEPADLLGYVVWPLPPQDPNTGNG